jgi:hypothetical protein
MASPCRAGTSAAPARRRFPYPPRIHSAACDHMSNGVSSSLSTQHCRIHTRGVVTFGYTSPGPPAERASRFRPCNASEGHLRDTGVSILAARAVGRPGSRRRCLDRPLPTTPGATIETARVTTGPPLPAPQFTLRPLRARKGRGPAQRLPDHGVPAGPPAAGATDCRRSRCRSCADRRESCSGGEAQAPCEALATTSGVWASHAKRGVRCRLRPLRAHSGLCAIRGAPPRVRVSGLERGVRRGGARRPAGRGRRRRRRRGRGGSPPCARSRPR